MPEIKQMVERINVWYGHYITCEDTMPYFFKKTERRDFFNREKAVIDAVLAALEGPGAEEEGKDRIDYMSLESFAMKANRDRDKLWCAALLCLDIRDIERVTERFNRTRPDKEGLILGKEAKGYKMKELIVYHNLTQCADGDVNKRFVYFRSTDVEQKNYGRLLWSVPDEWLYFLSLGKQIKVVDKSSNGMGKIERIFIPVLNDVLNAVLFDDRPQSRRFLSHVDLAMFVFIDVKLKAKFEFWKGKIKERVAIVAETIHISKELNPLVK